MNPTRRPNPDGVSGTHAAASQNSANAGPNNPQGQQPPYGGNDSGMDAGGGSPTGGFNPGPCTARSGMAGRGRNQADDCMTLAELNGCVDTPKPGADPDDPRGFCWTCILGQWVQVPL